MNMRDLMRLVETAGGITLYHGTCEANAKALMQNGWKPGSGQQGANMGQTRYLYVTNVVENALWFAQEKGCDTVVKLTNVPLAALQVDPEDGTGETVQDELNNAHGLPAYLVLTQPLSAEHFSQDLTEALVDQGHWPPVLKDRWAIADYIESVASAYVDNEYIAEHFRGCRAVLKRVPIAQIEPSDEDHNIPSKAKERRYAKMDPATMPPIVIEDGVIQDGHHRYRVAQKLGMTEMLCYVVEEI